MLRTAALLIAFVACATAVPVPVPQEEGLPLRQMAEHINAKQTTWKAGVHAHLEGASRSFIKSILGALPEPSAVKAPLKEINPSNDLPESFDPVDKWPQCESVFNNIRDQGGCGSCWAVSSTSNFNDRLCIAKNFTGELSQEDTLSCCTFLDFCGNGCNGGFPSGAWKHFKKEGLVTGGPYADKATCYPYEISPCEHHTTGPLPACKEGGSTPKCSKKCQSGYSKSWSDDKHFAATTYSVSSRPEEIMTEIMENGSVTVAFTVYEDFMTYKSGIYQHTSGSALGGHAVVMVGWGVDNGTPYWKVRNSWRKDWAEDGYFRIIRGQNECGIESSVVSGTVA